ncbi:MAG: pyridoxal phosphate-dependent aminotransferase [Candidatus Njordarchaeales archaeon]
MYNEKKYSSFANIPYSIIRQIAEKVLDINRKAKSEKEKVIDLTMGQNFLGNPRILFEAIKWLNNKDFNAPILYEPSVGSIDARESVAKNFYSFFYRFSSDEFSADNVMLTDGAFGAVRNALGAIMDPGDILVVDRLTFRYFIQALMVMGRLSSLENVFTLPADEDSGFIPKIDTAIEFLLDLKKRYSDRKIVYYTQFGFNPTGCFRTQKELKELVEFIEEEKNLFLINDIAYHLIRWNNLDIPLASYFADEDAGIVDADSLSKPFSLMGARVGVLITRNKELYRYAALVQQYSIVSPSKFCVDIWRAASHPEVLPKIREYLQKLVAEIRRNKELFEKRLEKLGFKGCSKSVGTIYSFLRVPRPSRNFYEELLNKAKVAVVPGYAFSDPSDPIGDQFIRATISLPPEKLEEGIRRIEQFFSSQDFT